MTDGKAPSINALDDAIAEVADRLCADLPLAPTLLKSGGIEDAKAIVRKIVREELPLQSLFTIARAAWWVRHWQQRYYAAWKDSPEKKEAFKEALTWEAKLDRLLTDSPASIQQETLEL